MILDMNGVAASLDFYAKAFGLPRRSFREDNDKDHGELETDAPRWAFARVALATKR